MSKSSRRNQKAALDQTQSDQQVQSGQTQSQTVNPVQVGSQKGSKAPQTRKPSPYAARVVGPIDDVEKEVEAKMKENAVSEPMMPQWVEDYLQYQAQFTQQIAGQIVEDHRVLIDHGHRLGDIEERLGLVMPPVEAQPAEEAEPLDATKTQPIELPVDAKVPEPETKEQPESEPEEQPEVVVASEAAILDFPAYVVPRQMYEAESFENGGWCKRGPFALISRASQVTNGDLSKVTIVQVWYNTNTDTVVRYLTPEEIDRYCY